MDERKVQEETPQERRRRINREAQARCRLQLSKERREARRAKNRERLRNKRRNESFEEAEIRRRKSAERMAYKRATENKQQTVQRLVLMSYRQALKRAKETPEQTAQRRRRDAESQRKHRNRKQVPLPTVHNLTVPKNGTEHHTYSLINPEGTSYSSDEDILRKKSWSPPPLPPRPPRSPPLHFRKELVKNVYKPPVGIALPPLSEVNVKMEVKEELPCPTDVPATSKKNCDYQVRKKAIKDRRKIFIKSEKPKQPSKRANEVRLNINVKNEKVLPQQSGIDYQSDRKSNFQLFSDVKLKSEVKDPLMPEPMQIKEETSSSSEEEMSPSPTNNVPMIQDPSGSPDNPESANTSENTLTIASTLRLALKRKMEETSKKQTSKYNYFGEYVAKILEELPEEVAEDAIFEINEILSLVRGVKKK